MRGGASPALSSSCPWVRRGGVAGLASLGKKKTVLPSPGSQQAPTASSFCLTFAPGFRRRVIPVTGACLALPPSRGLCLGSWMSVVCGAFLSQWFDAVW